MDRRRRGLNRPIHLNPSVSEPPLVDWKTIPASGTSLEQSENNDPQSQGQGGAETPIGWGGGGGVAGHVNESAELRRLEGFKTMDVYVS